MTELSYSLRIPYNKAKKFIQDCKGWSSCNQDETLIYNIKYVDNIHSYFYYCYFYFGYVELSICPKNFDLVIKSSTDNIFITSTDYECCDNLWFDLSECTRDFQIVINCPKEYDENDFYYTKKILRKKDGKFEIYYIDNENRVYNPYHEEDEEYYEDNENDKKYVDIEPSIFDKNFCDEGSGEDYSILLTEDEKRLVYSELNNLYGIKPKKEHYLDILNRLNIQ